MLAVAYQEVSAQDRRHWKEEFGQFSYPDQQPSLPLWRKDLRCTKYLQAISVCDA